MRSLAARAPAPLPGAGLGAGRPPGRLPPAGPPRAGVRAAAEAPAGASKAKGGAAGAEGEAKPAPDGRLRPKRFESKEYQERGKEALKQIELERSRARDALDAAATQAIRSGVSRGKEEAMRRARRRGRRSSGSAAADDEYERLRTHLLATATDDNPLRGATMFCDAEQPQWFALMVTSPEPQQAARVVRILDYARERLPPVALPSGGTAPRELEVLNPRKEVQAVSLATGRPRTRLVSWRQGAVVFMRCVMDAELLLYLHPWIDDVTEYWWRFLGRTPRETLVSGFAGGQVIDSRYHFPRPCPQELLDEAREWLRTPEEWDEQQTLAYEYGSNPPSDAGLAQAADLDVASATPQQMKRLDRMYERSGRRDLSAVEQERLILKGLLNDSASQVRRQAQERQLRDLEKQDAGGWNVGGVQFRRQTRHGQPESVRRGGGRPLRQQQAPRRERSADRWDGSGSGGRREQQPQWAADSAAGQSPGGRRGRSFSAERGRDAVGSQSGWFSGAGDSDEWLAEDEAWLLGGASAGTAAPNTAPSSSSSSSSSGERSQRSSGADSAAPRDPVSDNEGFSDDDWAFWEATAPAAGEGNPAAGSVGSTAGAADWLQDSAAGDGGSWAADGGDGWQSSGSGWYEGSGVADNVGSTSAGWREAAAALRDQASREAAAGGGSGSGWYEPPQQQQPQQQQRQQRAADPPSQAPGTVEAAGGAASSGAAAGRKQASSQAGSQQPSSQQAGSQRKALASDGGDGGLLAALNGLASGSSPPDGGAQLGRAAPGSAGPPGGAWGDFNNMPGGREPQTGVPVPDLPASAFKWVLEKGVVQDDRWRSLEQLREETEAGTTGAGEQQRRRSPGREPAQQQQQQQQWGQKAPRQTPGRRDGPPERSHSSDWRGAAADAGRRGGSPRARERAGAELAVGARVAVGGGRYRGSSGTVVGLRPGVARLRMDGSEGPAEADVAAAHCQRL